MWCGRLRTGTSIIPPPVPEAVTAPIHGNRSTPPNLLGQGMGGCVAAPACNQNGKHPEVESKNEHGMALDVRCLVRVSAIPNGATCRECVTHPVLEYALPKLWFPSAQ